MLTLPLSTHQHTHTHTPAAHPPCLPCCTSAASAPMQSRSCHSPELPPSVGGEGSPPDGQVCPSTWHQLGVAASPVCSARCLVAVAAPPPGLLGGPQLLPACTVLLDSDSSPKALVVPPVPAFPTQLQVADSTESDVIMACSESLGAAAAPAGKRGGGCSSSRSGAAS